MKTIVLFHANCTDGAGAMWSAWKHFGDEATYIPIGKQSKKGSVLLNQCKRADDVFMCDMMLDMESIAKIASAKTIVHLLDHHITNIEQFKNYNFSPFQIPYIRDFCDLNRSGAGITWDHFHSGSRPALINYVEDFDLWHWAMPDGDSIHALLGQYNWKDNDTIIEIFEELSKLSPGHLAAKGKPISDFKKFLIEKNMSQVGRAIVLGKYNIPILNTNHFISETGNLMRQGEPFAIIWSFMANGKIRMSLRSADNAEDVSKISQQLGYGGGGHRNASGTSYDSYEDMKFQIEIV